MENHPDPRLEKFIDRQLRGLPELKAPPTLVPRVLAAIQIRQRQQIWWQQPWLQWPRPAQVISCALAMLAIATAYFALPDWDSLAVNTLPEKVAHRFALFSWLWEIGSSLVNTVTAILHAFQPWLIYGFAVLFLMYLTCVGLGTICFRVAFYKREDF